MRRFMTALLATMAGAFLLASPANATIKIGFDPGGSIMEYIEKYSIIDAADGKFIIDGSCISACTLITGLVQPKNVCVTPRARLAFHSAWQEGPDGKGEVFSADGTELVWQTYPEKVRALLRKHGWNGHTEHPDLIWIEGAELHTLFKPCGHTA